ncbi:DUF333 domain-containing protein [Methanoregula sp.]|uniref:putative hemolysin n=1 Tax=Methanoregula sp. TaxID=2052170 RepID=UPI002BE9A414|nr:DUF333 domain-containing protein [Methanoregula sp.]HVP96533.1 DUF333 domain-containing protein [Methanoregula sp.]
MKTRFSVILILGLCLAAGIVIAGCTQSSTPAQVTTTTPASTTAAQAPQTGTAGMANPASVNCVNVGGTLQIMDSPAGQYGMCNFPNGTSCEEWALFRGEGCQPGVAANQTVNATAPAGQTGMANPASVNCVNVGGTLQIENSPAGQYGMCNFPNGTSCEEWALFRGEGCKAANVTA